MEAPPRPVTIRPLAPEREIQVLCPAVQRAALAAAQVRLRACARHCTKPDGSPVTAADLAAQALILDTIRRTFPDDGVVAEEDPGIALGDDLLATVREALRAAGIHDPSPAWIRDAIGWRGRPGAERVWFVDPLDGTKGFLDGLSYAVCVALVVGREPVLGMLAIPDLRAVPGEAGERILVHAARGAGAFQEPLDGDADPVPLRVATTEGPLRLVGSRLHDEGGALARLVAAIPGARYTPYDSQAKYALVARGSADAYVRVQRPGGRPVCAWDHAAGTIILQEAGGRVTDQAGRPLDFSQGERLAANRGIVAASVAAHGLVLDAVRGGLG